VKLRPYGAIQICLLLLLLLLYLPVQALSGEVMSKHASLQELNFAADELMKASTADQAALIREPLTDINRHWETLHHNIGKKMVRFVIVGTVLRTK